MVFACKSIFYFLCACLFFGTTVHAEISPDILKKFSRADQLTLRQIKAIEGDKITLDNDSVWEITGYKYGKVDLPEFKVGDLVTLTFISLPSGVQAYPNTKTGDDVGFTIDFTEKEGTVGKSAHLNLKPISLGKNLTLKSATLLNPNGFPTYKLVLSDGSEWLGNWNTKDPWQPGDQLIFAFLKVPTLVQGNFLIINLSRHNSNDRSFSYFNTTYGWKEPNP